MGRRSAAYKKIGAIFENESKLTFEWKARENVNARFDPDRNWRSIENNRVKRSIWKARERTLVSIRTEYINRGAVVTSSFLFCIA